MKKSAGTTAENEEARSIGKKPQQVSKKRSEEIAAYVRWYIDEYRKEIRNHELEKEFSPMLYYALPCTAKVFLFPNNSITIIYKKTESKDAPALRVEISSSDIESVFDMIDEEEGVHYDFIFPFESFEEKDIRRKARINARLDIDAVRQEKGGEKAADILSGVQTKLDKLLKAKPMLEGALNNRLKDLSELEELLEPILADYAVKSRTLLSYRKRLEALANYKESGAGIVILDEKIVELSDEIERLKGSGELRTSLSHSGGDAAFEKKLADIEDVVLGMDRKIERKIESLEPQMADMEKRFDSLETSSSYNDLSIMLESIEDRLEDMDIKLLNVGQAEKAQELDEKILELENKIKEFEGSIAGLDDRLLGLKEANRTAHQMDSRMQILEASISGLKGKVADQREIARILDKMNKRLREIDSRTQGISKDELKVSEQIKNTVFRMNRRIYDMKMRLEKLEKAKEKQ